MQIKWLRTARKNLDDEATYIAQDDAIAASRVVARVFHTSRRLPERW